MDLSEIGEFGLIDRFSRRFVEGLPPGIRGIGDDCAVIDRGDGTSLLVTTDLLIEGTHFLLDRIPPRHLGHKSLAVNLSDIAAMGGSPHSAYLSIGLSARVDVAWVDAFFEGLGALAGSTGTLLLGGDTTRAPDRLVINLTVLGSAMADRVKLRSSARRGDTIHVTGPLGDSGVGLRCLLEGTPADTDASALIDRHHLPRPHLEEGRWLAARPEVRAMMDVSDGIDSDLRRVMDRSSVGVEVDLDLLPISPEARRLCRKMGWSAEELAATGGEDYCLACTVDPHGRESVEAGFAEAFGLPLQRIGTVVEGGFRYLRGGREVSLERRGFDHFVPTGSFARAKEPGDPGRSYRPPPPPPDARGKP